MKKLLFIISLAVLLILSFVLLRNGAFSPIETGLEADSLTEMEMKKWEKKQIVTKDDSVLSDVFFKKWEEASAKYARYARLHSNPEIDSIYQKVFTYITDSLEKRALKYKDYKIDNTKYIVLPCQVKVCTFDTVVEQSSKRTNRNRKEAVVVRHGYLPGYECVATNNYIPHITSDKPVLYDFPTIHKALENYLDEDKDKKENKKERTIGIKKSGYIPIAHYHWGDGWYFVSMPIINCIYIYDKGVVATTRTSWSEGCTIFFPLGSDDIEEISSWIE